MSSICIFNIQDDLKEYVVLNNIAKELVKTALENEMGIFFANTFYKDINFINKMNNSFLLSDSFLYVHSDELLCTNGFWNDRNIVSYKKKFIEKFQFFNIVLDKLYFLGIRKIEIYFADLDDTFDDFNEFEIIQTNREKFLNDLLSVTLENMNEFGGTVPTSLKFLIDVV